MSLQQTTSQDEIATHDECGGELIVPVSLDGQTFGAPQGHPRQGDPRVFMVTCEDCAVVGFTDNTQLLSMARKVARRFVVEAVR